MEDLAANNSAGVGPGGAKDSMSAGGRFLAAVGLAGIIVAAFFAVVSVTRPYIGAEVAKKGDGWVVVSLDSIGLATSAGVQVGDRVASVNGYAPQDLPTASSKVRTRVRTMEIRSLTIVRGGDSPLTVSLDEDTPIAQATEVGVYSLLGLSFWGIGAFVLLRKSSLLPARLLYSFGTAIAVGLTTVAAVDRGIPLAVHFEFASHLLIGPLFAHLFLTFPVRVSGRSRLVYLLYLPSAAAFLLFVLMRGDAETDVWSRTTVLPILTIGVLAGLVSLVRNTVRAGYVRIRQQARIVTAGAFVGVVPFLGFSVLPYMASTEPLIPPKLSAIALAALPASIAYALVRHQLFDIDLVIRRAVVRVLLTLGVIAGYLATLVFVSALLANSGTSVRLIAIGVLGALSLMTYAPIRERLQAALDRRFYRDRYDYRQVLRSLSGSLAKMTDQEDIAHFITASVSQVLGTYGACLLLHSKQGYLYARSATGRYADSPGQASLTAYANALTESDSFPNMAGEQSGAAFFIPLQVGGRHVGILCLGNKASREGFSVDDLSFLFTFSSQAAAALENASLFAETKQHRVELDKAYGQLQESAEELIRRKKELESAYLGMARTLVLTLESRDPYTRGHSERVSRLVQRIAPALGIAGDDLQKLELAARLHDIGKTGVADAVLLKPSSYDPGERAEIERHPTRGVEILRFLDFLRDVLPTVESHHEWFDGSGYPRGLKGEEIPLGGRIMAVADAYDAMVSKRPYRPALPHQEAIRRLKEGSGTQWDPRVVQAFMKTETG